jgi:hypothetical protein
MRAVALALTLVVAGPSATALAQPAPSTAAPDDEPLTTEIFRPRRAPLEPAWMLLSLPEQAVRTAFLPLTLLVTLAESYRLDRRIPDLLRNDARTIVVTPDIKLSAGGFGAGATVSFKRLGQGALDVGGLGRINGDWALEAEYERDLVFAEGRTLTLTALAELDQNLRYYGIGPRSEDADKRVLQSEALDANASIDVTGRGVVAITGLAELGVHHQRLSAGSDPSTPSAGEPGDMVAPPPDFDRSLDFGRFRARVRYDTRDTEGRPSRGFAIEVAASMVQELTGASFSAVGGSTAVEWLIPVLPDHRVFIVRAGTQLTAPFAANHEIPLYALTSLGRRNVLRGYGSDRFRDRHGWWANAAYRFPVYEYINTGVALDAELFVETGSVAGSVEDLFAGPVAYDGGVAVRAGYDATNFFRIELGVSPEGPVLGFAVGKSL